MIDKKNIHPNMRMSILHTISKQIYSSLYVKIREAVSNSYDNNATCFIYFYDKDNRKLSLYDNGTGISQARMKEILEGIGYGSGRLDHTQNSYFGLGLFSVLELGGSVDIYTMTSNGEYNHFYFNTKEIFDEKNAKESISKLIDFFVQEEVSSFRTKSPLDDEIIKECLGQSRSCFTEIVISDIKQENIELLASDGFRKNLEKILPLKYNKKHPFFDKITDLDNKKKIQTILDDKKYCKGIDFYSGTYDVSMYKHERYFPQLKHSVSFDDTNIVVGESKAGNFAYFFVYNYEDIEEDAPSDETQNQDDSGFGNIDSDTGFWVRNKNFLVKPADYFQKAGTRKKILDSPLATWLYGEIFHVDMTEFLVVTRDEYVWSSPKFNDFYEEIKKLVVPLNSKLRDAWRKSRNITDIFYAPFADIGTPKSPFRRINSLYEEEDDGSILKVLNKLRVEKLEDDKLTLPNLLSKHDGIFTIVDNDDFLIHIDPKSRYDNIVKKWDPRRERPVIMYPGDVFNNKQETLFGKQYETIFVFGQETDEIISIDTDSQKIYLNPFNKLALDYSLSKLDIIFAIEFAYAKSGSKKEMKDNLYLILGNIDPMSRTSVLGLFDVFSKQLGV